MNIQMIDTDTKEVITETTVEEFISDNDDSPLTPNWPTDFVEELKEHGESLVAGFVGVSFLIKVIK